MASIREVVLEYLTGIGWSFDERESFVAAPVTAEHGDWTVLFFIPDDGELLIIHSLLPIDVEPDVQLNVAVYLTHANFGLSSGNFELDLGNGQGNGEVRYKTSIDVAGTELNEALLRNLLNANIASADHYLPGLEQAATGRPALECLPD